MTELRPLAVVQAYALLAGRSRGSRGPAWHADYPMTETVAGLALLVGAYEQLGGRPRRRPPWWTHQIVADDEVVGDVGFHGPPADGEVEIGYAVVPARRGQGIATEACRLIVRQAWRGGADRVRARVAPDNAASRAVLERNGFTALGADEYVLARPER